MPRLASIFLDLASGGGSNGLGCIRAPSSLMALSTSYSGHALADAPPSFPIVYHRCRCCPVTTGHRAAKIGQP
jgi:hypothetical protein